MSVGEICNREVVIVRAGESVPKAARLMREYHVGDLVVMSEDQGRRVPVGILSDRDMVVDDLIDLVALVGNERRYERKRRSR